MGDLPRILDGRYRVDQLIGQGGFGAVYAGHHLTLDVPLAIKVLRFEKAMDGGHRAKLVVAFLEEGRLLVRLRHPNIVAALDLGVLTEGVDDGPTPYLVMEWVPGVTLQEVLSQRGSGLPPPLAWALFRPLVEALAFAHAARVVHRDLKPGNVMVQSGLDGRAVPRVIDFGVAKTFEEETLAGSGATVTASPGSAFTPAYAAPEQVTQARTGPWTDVHALALIFFELVTGERPFKLDANIRLAVVDPERPSPRQHGVDVGAFEDVLARALSLRPAARFADACELLRALDLAAAETFAEAPHAPLFRELVADSLLKAPADERASAAANAPSVTALTSTPAATPPPTPARVAFEEPSPMHSARVLEPATPLLPATTADDIAPASATPPAPLSPASALRPKLATRTALGLASLAVVAVAAVVAPQFKGPDKPLAPAAAPPPSPLLASTTTLACPILEASGVEEPSAWLGAAVAHALCRRALWRLGGRAARVRGPAELLDVPRAPNPDFPADPFAAMGARERTLTAAATRADAFLDGSVTRGSTTFALTLTLRAKDGSTVASVSAESSDVLEAASKALDALDAKGVFPKRAIDPDAKRVTLVPTVEDGLAIEELAAHDDESSCGLVRARAGELGARGALLRACDPKATGKTALDRSSPFALGFSAAAALADNPDADLRDVPSELARAREKEPTPEGRATLAALAAYVESQQPKHEDKARDLALLALSDDPTDAFGWATLDMILASRGAPAMFAQAAAYSPSVADSWLQLGQASEEQADRARFMKRALALRGCYGDLVDWLGAALVNVGATSEALSLAARCQNGKTPASHLSIALLRARVDLAEGRPGQGHDSVRAALLSYARYGNPPTFQALLVALRSATLLGTERALADAWLDRFVLAEPPLLDDQPDLATEIGRMALLASPAKGEAALKRVLALSERKALTIRERDREWYRGALRATAGDARGAVTAWRKGLAKETRTWLPAWVFDEAGEPELAEEIDAGEALQPVYFGLGLPAPRMALRAEKRGDKERARKLARELVEKWSTSDRALPAVGAMRALLDRLK